MFTLNLNDGYITMFSYQKDLSEAFWNDLYMLKIRNEWRYIGKSLKDCEPGYIYNAEPIKNIFQLNVTMEFVTDDNDVVLSINFVISE